MAPSAQSGPGRVVYLFGPFTLNPAERLLLREGQAIPLTPKAFDTLLVLVRNAGHLVARDDLMRSVWPDTFVEEGGLTRNISVLRKALGGLDTGEEYIATLAKQGYRFVADVRELTADAGLQGGDGPGEVVLSRRTTRIVAEIDDEPAALPAPRERAALSRPAVALAAAAVLVSAAVVYVRDTKTGRPAAARSLAVLPFRPLGLSREDDYLGVALADALITRLGNVRTLTLRPTSAVLKYEGRAVEAARAAQELKVDAVLEGSIQREKDRLRITAQLVSAETGAPLWTGKFDEAFEAVLAIEDSVSDSVAHALSLSLTAGERARLRRRPTENAEAHQAYLQGRYFWNKRNPEAVVKAIGLFQRAVEIDPTYALAYSGLADCWLVIGNHQYAAPRAAYPKAREAVVRALELDDSLGEAHASLGSLNWEFDWDWRAAETEFQRALELSPVYPTAHQWYAEYLSFMGRTEESMAEIDRACALDPVSPVISGERGFLLYYAERFDASILALRQTLQLDPGWVLARIYLTADYLQLKDYAAAEKEGGEARKVLGDSALAFQSHAYAAALAGRRAEALASLERLRQLPPETYADAYFTAAAYMALGDFDEAFRWLDRAYEERSYWMPTLKRDPGVKQLRSDPRFAALVKRVGIP